MDRPKCPDCGTEIGPDQPHGLCPACLLEQTLHSDTMDPVTASAAVADPIKQALEEKLRSQYRIIRLLGRGGMGAVYLARDLTLEREVAIKVVSASANSRDAYDRFRREAKTAARLSHPNLVPLHAFGEVEGMPYFVMGYVRGESLAAKLRRDGAIPEDDVRRIVGDVAHALDHAHRLGVVHRDVKPDNVLLDDETGRALLTDFGVAKAIGTGDALTQFGGVVGTPHYMSPEQARGGSVDARTDVYSLGVMAYAMLAGRLPFEGGTPAEVLSKHLTQQPPALRPIAPAASDTMVHAVDRCMAKDPAARWQDARSLAQALGATEVSQLPDALQAVEGRGLPALMIVLAYLAFYWSITSDPGPTIGGGVLFAGLYVFALFSLRREGFSLRQLQSVLWREPAWWPFWYPAPLRRPGSVWTRLPVRLRQFRVWTTLLFVVIWAMPHVLAFLAGYTHSIRMTGATGRVIMAVVAPLLVIWFVLRGRATAELKRKGLDGRDAFRALLSVPAARAGFWGRPHVAAILAPAAPAATQRADSPHDQLQSILRDGNELPGPFRPLGTEAAVAARQLIAAIEHSDRRIAGLMRSIEPGEEERLEDKLAVLSGDDAAPLRTLLEKQLELVRDLSSALEAAKEQRNRQIETIRMLSLHLASLRARAMQTPAEVRHLSDRVRSLCAAIAGQAAAADAAGDALATMPRV